MTDFIPAIRRALKQPCQFDLLGMVMRQHGQVKRRVFVKLPASALIPSPRDAFRRRLLAAGYRSRNALAAAAGVSRASVISFERQSQSLSSRIARRIERALQS